jgi:trk system potassium uptake protein TrkA
VEPFEFISNGGGGEALPCRVKRRFSTFYEIIKIDENSISENVEEKPMKGLSRIAVLGLGDFGYHFACELNRLGHEVLAVDSNQSKVQQILPNVTKAAVADVRDHAALEELGIAGFDIVAVCLPEQLETAVLLVHYLHQIQTPQILVKVSNAEQAEIVKLVGATKVIQPDLSTAMKAAMLIHHPQAFDYLELGDGYMIVALRPGGPMIARSLEEIALEERYGVSVLAVWQSGQEYPLQPPGHDCVISDTDILILAGHIDQLRKVRKIK